MLEPLLQSLPRHYSRQRRHLIRIRFPLIETVEGISLAVRRNGTVSRNFSRASADGSSSEGIREHRGKADKIKTAMFRRAKYIP